MTKLKRAAWDENVWYESTAVMLIIISVNKKVKRIPLFFNLSACWAHKRRSREKHIFHYVYLYDEGIIYFGLCPGVCFDIPRQESENNPRERS
jgi:hypothetical protein